MFSPIYSSLFMDCLFWWLAFTLIALIEGFEKKVHFYLLISFGSITVWAWFIENPM